MECIKKHTNPGETILIFSGLLNFMVRKAFLRALKDAQSERTQHVILDLTQVSFIDCSVLGILVQAIQDLTQTQTTLSLMAAPGRVFNALQTLQLNKMISIVPTPQET